MSHSLTPLLSGPDSSGVAFLDGPVARPLPPRDVGRTLGTPTLATRLAVAALGLAAYGAALASFVAFAAFLGGALPGGGVDGRRVATAPGLVAAVDLGLLLLLVLQHATTVHGARASAVAGADGGRHPAISRSLFVLATSLGTAILVIFWQPLPTPLWTLSAPGARVAVEALFVLGVGLVATSSLLLEHLHVLGLAPAWAFLRGRPHREIRFRMPGPYRFVRHPMAAGFLLMLWATPELTVGRLLLASLLTTYLGLALRREERDLARELGGLYGLYQTHVPAFLPGLPSRRVRGERRPPWAR